MDQSAKLLDREARIACREILRSNTVILGALEGWSQQGEAKEKLRRTGLAQMGEELESL